MNIPGLFGASKSNTVRGVAILAMLWFLQSQGVVPAGTVESSPAVQDLFPEGALGAIAEAVKAVGVVVTTFGGRNLLLKVASAMAGK